MQNLPNGYKLIKNNHNYIELKSKYHYWALLRNRQNPKTFFLYHKHKYSFPYHRQLIFSKTFNWMIKYIQNHDNYYDNKKL